MTRYIDKEIIEQLIRMYLVMPDAQIRWFTANYEGIPEGAYVEIEKES